MSSYMLPSLDSLLGYLNKKNATTFKLADLVFSAPTPINGTWREVANPHNTAIRVSASPTSAFQGTQVITYDRLKISDLVNLPGFAIAADRPFTSMNLLDPIRHYNGVQFTADDIEDTPVTDNGDGTFTCTLTAKATSIGWIGSGEVTIRQGGAALDAVLAVANLPGLNYPTAGDNEIYAALYLYPYDFTVNFDLLLDIEEGVPLTATQANALIAAINAQDISSGKGLWNNAQDQLLWSLNGAIPSYNGLNAAEFLTNSSYKYAMMLDLRPEVTAPKGTLVFHYNDPIDSGSV